MENFAQVISDIQSLKIQGATNVALAVLGALKNYLSQFPVEQPFNLTWLDTAAQVAYVRPTEPLAQNALRFIFADRGKTAPFYLRKVSEYETLILAAKNKLVEHGLTALTDGGVYLTHCHSSTLVKLFVAARKKSKIFAVYLTETRPLYQGRTTAQELLKTGFDDVTMIVDDLAYSLIAGRKGALDAIFIGADLLSTQGFVNKVGSLAIVDAAKEKDVPVYILASLLKFDPRQFTLSLIEERSGSEIWPKAPKALKFYNPAFDFIPYRDNLKLICEAGIIPLVKASEFAKLLYPFLHE